MTLTNKQKEYLRKILETERSSADADEDTKYLKNFYLSSFEEEQVNFEEEQLLCYGKFTDEFKVIPLIKKTIQEILLEFNSILNDVLHTKNIMNELAQTNCLPAHTRFTTMLDEHLKLIQNMRTYVKNNRYTSTYFDIASEYLNDPNLTNQLAGDLTTLQIPAQATVNGVTIQDIGRLPRRDTTHGCFTDHPGLMMQVGNCKILYQSFDATKCHVATCADRNGSTTADQTNLHRILASQLRQLENCGHIPDVIVLCELTVQTNSKFSDVLQENRCTLNKQYYDIIKTNRNGGTNAISIMATKKANITQHKLTQHYVQFICNNIKIRVAHVPGTNITARNNMSGYLNTLSNDSHPFVMLGDMNYHLRLTAMQPKANTEVNDVVKQVKEKAKNKSIIELENLHNIFNPSEKIEYSNAGNNKNIVRMFVGAPNATDIKISNMSIVPKYRLGDEVEGYFSERPAINPHDQATRQHINAEYQKTPIAQQIQQSQQQLQTQLQKDIDTLETQKSIVHQQNGDTTSLENQIKDLKRQKEEQEQKLCIERAKTKLLISRITHAEGILKRPNDYTKKEIEEVQNRINQYKQELLNVGTPVTQTNQDQEEQYQEEPSTKRRRIDNQNPTTLTGG